MTLATPQRLVLCVIGHYPDLTTPEMQDYDQGPISISNKMSYYKMLKLRDWQFRISHCFEIWQAHQQQYCRGACQISEPLDYSKYKYCRFKTSRDLMIRFLSYIESGPWTLCGYGQLVTHWVLWGAIYYFEYIILKIYLYPRPTELVVVGGYTGITLSVCLVCLSVCLSSVWIFQFLESNFNLAFNIKSKL